MIDGYNPYHWECTVHQVWCNESDVSEHADCRLTVYHKHGSNNYSGRAVIAWQKEIGPHVCDFCEPDGDPQ